MSNTKDQQQAAGNGLMQKRHSSGEHVNLQIKLQAPEELKFRRQSSPVLQSQHISLHHRTKETASKPAPPPHPSVSPELAKLLNIHKSRASNDIHVIDSRSKNAPQVCTSSIPHKSTKSPPKRPDPPKQTPHTHAFSAPAVDPPGHSSTTPNPPTPPPPSSTPPPPTPSPPPPTTTPKRIPVRKAPPPPNDKTSLKNKSAAAHKSYEKVSLNNKGTPPPSEKATKAASGHKRASKNDKATPAPPPPSDKASSKAIAASVHKIYEKISKSDRSSSKTKAASDHKTYDKVDHSSNDKTTPPEKVSSNDKATPVHKKISMDSKIAPLLEQFERASSNNTPIQMPGALYSAATKPQTSAIPKSHSTDILSPEKTSFPKSQSTDLLSPTSSTIPKSQSTDPLKPQLTKSHSSVALKTQKSVIPKSQSSAVLKSQKSSLPKENLSTPKKDSSSLKQDSPPTSKPPSKTWKPKNSKLQALFHKAERRKRKKTKEKKVSEAHHDQEAKHAEEKVHPTEAKRAEENSRPIEAIYAVVQKINMDDSLTPQTATLLDDNTKEQSSQTPGCWIPPEDVPPISKDPNCEHDSQNRKISLDNAKLTVGSQYSREDVYASLKKITFKANEEETLPPLPPRLYVNVFDDPSIAEHDSHVHDMERAGANHNLKAQLQESMDNTYAVMHNPRNKGYGDIAVSSEQEELPPLPPRLYENIFDDPSIAEHAEQNYQSNDHATTRDSKAQLQESMDNTYAVMHNPRNKGNNDSRKSGEQEELPPLPPKLYVNIFDDATVTEHKHDTANGGDQEELPPPLPPKLYENIFDDPSIAEHTVGDTANTTGSEQEELPPPLPPKMYENVFDDPAGSARHSDGDHAVKRGATHLTNGATSQDSKAQLQESADNTYAVMHNPRSQDKGESAKSSEQEDIYIVMHPHPAFMPLIKKYFKNPKSK